MTPYFDDGKGHVIYCGDCLEVLGEIGPNSTQWILTDPPFYLPTQYYSSRKNWPKSLGDLAVMHGYFTAVAKAIRVALSPGGGMYCFCDTVSHAVFVSLLYPHFDDLLTIVWDKGVGGLGRGWRHSHEFILHARDKTTAYQDGFRRDVLAFKTVNSEDRRHPAEKPLGLLISLLQTIPPGQTVLDPFAGTGTLGLACKVTGHKAVLIEISEEYAELAARRLEQECFDLTPAPEPAAVQQPGLFPAMEGAEA